MASASRHCSDSRGRCGASAAPAAPIDNLGRGSVVGVRMAPDVPKSVSADMKWENAAASRSSHPNHACPARCSIKPARLPRSGALTIAERCVRAAAETRWASPAMRLSLDPALASHRGDVMAADIDDAIHRATPTVGAFSSPLMSPIAARGSASLNATNFSTCFAGFRRDQLNDRTSHWGVLNRPG
jgi:hypothetical protein